MKEIEDHKLTLDKNVTRDFIDAFLHKIEETTDPSSSFFGDLGRLNMRNSMFDLFIAGMDTTANTIRCIIQYCTYDLVANICLNIFHVAGV